MMKLLKSINVTEFDSYIHISSQGNDAYVAGYTYLLQDDIEILGKQILDVFDTDIVSGSIYFIEKQTPDIKVKTSRIRNLSKKCVYSEFLSRMSSEISDSLKNKPYQEDFKSLSTHLRVMVSAESTTDLIKLQTRLEGLCERSKLPIRPNSAQELSQIYDTFFRIGPERITNIKKGSLGQLLFESHDEQYSVSTGLLKSSSRPVSILNEGYGQLLPHTLIHHIYHRTLANGKSVTLNQSSMSIFKHGDDEGSYNAIDENWNSEVFPKTEFNIIASEKNQYFLNIPGFAHLNNYGINNAILKMDKGVPSRIYSEIHHADSVSSGQTAESYNIASIPMRTLKGKSFQADLSGQCVVLTGARTISNVAWIYSLISRFSSVDLPTYIIDPSNSHQYFSLAGKAETLSNPGPFIHAFFPSIFTRNADVIEAYFESYDLNAKFLRNTVQHTDSLAAFISYARDRKGLPASSTQVLNYLEQEIGLFHSNKINRRSFVYLAPNNHSHFIDNCFWGILSAIESSAMSDGGILFLDDCDWLISKLPIKEILKSAKQANLTIVFNMGTYSEYSLSTLHELAESDTHIALYESLESSIKLDSNIQLSRIPGYSKQSMYLSMNNNRHGSAIVSTEYSSHFESLVKHTDRDKAALRTLLASDIQNQRNLFNKIIRI